MKKASIDVHFFLIFAFIFLLLAGCSTPSSKQSFNPYALFNSTNTLYVSIPVQENRQLIETVVHSAFSGIKQSDLDAMLNRSSTIYLASSEKSSTLNTIIPDYQMIVTGNFPSAFSDFVFAKKNGWLKTTETIKEKKTTYYQLSGSIQASLVSGIGIFSSRGAIVDLFESFYAEQTMENRPLNWSKPVQERLLNFSGVSAGAYPADTIHFYSSNPSDLLKKLISAPLTLPLQTLTGSFKKMENNLFYQGLLHIEVSNSRLVQGTVFLIKKSLPFFSGIEASSNINVEAGLGNEIIISGLIVDIQKFLNFLQ